MKKILIVLLALLIMTTAIFADQVTEIVEAMKNQINVTLNGQPVEADNLLYNGRTYVQLHEITKMIGADLTWYADTETAALVVNQMASESVESPEKLTSKTVKFKGYSNPIVAYSDLGIKKEDIFGVAFEGDLPVSYELSDQGLQIIGQFSTNTVQELMIVKKDHSLTKVTLKDSGLAQLSMNDEVQVVFIPAEPSKGFNFPYYIRIPGKNEIRYNTSKKYITFDMLNNGGGNSLDQCIDDAYEQLSETWYMSMRRAAEFGYPMIMPIVPRTAVGVEEDTFGSTWLYEHALDRPSVYVRELTTSDSHANSNIRHYNDDQVDYKLYYDFDDQIAAMIQHAIDYLNDNDFNVEDRIIMDGYSASGTFTDRFTNLHPEIIKMVVSGATTDDLMLPVSTYKGKELAFPIGISDYQAITGKAFDLQAHNSVARLIYMGKDDTNNVALYSDCYTSLNKDIMNNVFPDTVLERALENIKVYGESGGKGLFILDVGIQHGSSRDMDDYINEFIKANADSDTPVYPEVKSSNLEKTLFK